MVRRNLQKASQSRVFTIEDRAGPSHTPEYQSLTRVSTGVSWGQGDITPVRVADPKQYGRFIVVDKIQGQQDLPTLSLEARTTRDLSAYLSLVRKGCPIDLQIHVGACKDPSDFDAGWEKVIVLEDANFTNYSTSELGAFDADQEVPVTETLDMVGADYYELKPIAFGQVAESEIVQSVTGIAICDSRICGVCGLPSDGCQRIFAVQTATGASPGLPAEVVYTEDAGATFAESIVTSLPVNRTPDKIACVGPYLTLVSNDDCSYHFALINDILAGDESWTKSAVGFVCPTGAPNDIFSLSRTQTWVVGDGGYVYFSEDITTGFDVQSAGDATTEDLNDIHGYDEANLVAVGDLNAILLTRSGGRTWSLVTGPAGQAAVNATACWMLSENEWFVGYADGKLFYTIDSGNNWVEKLLPGTPTSITAIKFSTRCVGYLSYGAAGPAGRILRTISGGRTWYVLPETAGLTIPSNAAINDLAACGEDPNVVWAGGLETVGGDGILIKGS